MPVGHDAVVRARLLQSGIAGSLVLPFRAMRRGPFVCMLSRPNAEEKYGLYRFDTEIVQHLQFQKSIFLHIEAPFATLYILSLSD